MMLHAAAFCALAALGCADGDGPDSNLQTIGTMTHGPIRECSGIAASRQYPNTFWVHNDSGNPAALYAVRRDGRLIREYRVNALNLDWEDIALDGRNRIYIGDLGDNLGVLPYRTIYRFAEPNPSRPASKPLKPEATFSFRYPEDQRFDCESLCIEGNGSRALVIAKRKDGRDADVFAVPIGQPSITIFPAIAQRLGALPDFVEQATGADLSPNGRYLAVCGYNAVRVYEKAADATNPWRLAAVVRFEVRSSESIAWDSADLLLGREDRRIDRIRFDPPFSTAIPPRPRPKP